MQLTLLFYFRKYCVALNNLVSHTTHKNELKKKTPKMLLHLTCKPAQIVFGKHYDMPVAQNGLLDSLEDVASQANRSQLILVESLRTMATNFA
jgi:hypothetical protein